MTSRSPTFLQSYFLRVYSKEVGRPRKTLGFTPRGEAIFQTFLLVSIALSSVSGAVVFILLRTEVTREFMLHYRYPISVSGVIASCGLAFAIGRRVSGGVRDADQLVSKFATSHEQTIGHVQFWSVLVLSLCMPWVVAFLYGDV